LQAAKSKLAGEKVQHDLPVERKADSLEERGETRREESEDLFRMGELVEAVKAGASRRVKTILDHHPFEAKLVEEDVALLDPDGGGLLHLCVTSSGDDPSNNAGTLKLLVQKKWDPTRTNTLGETPLCFAVRQAAAPAIVEALLDVRSNPNMADKEGQPPLLVAVRSVEVSLTRVLLQGRATPDAGDSFGETALMEAAGMGDTELCRMLLQARADINRANQFKLTAMHFAEDLAVSELFRQSIAGVADTLNEPRIVGGDALVPGGDSLEPRVREPRGEVVLNWVIPFERIRVTRKNEFLDSAFFEVPGLPCTLCIKYWPKGQSNIVSPSRQKGACCSIAVTHVGGKGLPIRVDFFIHGESDSRTFWHGPLTEKPVGAYNFCSSPNGEVAISVRYSPREEAEGTLAGLDVWYRTGLDGV
jgi:hypothetical protein